MNGVLVIDKPEGLTSAKTLEHIKRHLGIKKAGHAGTLDPFATGVLVCCLGQATRLSRFFLKAHKVYEGTITLGVETDTLDCTGNTMVRREVDGIAAADVQTLFSRYHGASQQVPPVFSALKHEGVPLYKLARAGKPVTKPPREIFIDEMILLSMNLPHLRFRVRCSAGTYVRVLASDIGKALGCGGHLSSLRRLESGCFSLDMAMDLSELRNAAGDAGVRDCLISMTDALYGMPEFQAEEGLALRIMQGKPIGRADLPLIQGKGFGGYLKVVDQNRHLLAVLDVSDPDAVSYCCVLSDRDALATHSES